MVLEARHISKTFRIPEQKVDTLKERATHPFAKNSYRMLRALKDVSFDVHRGEFFGIVGRNGSGKSTLLKIMAGIYSADAGKVRMAGRMAPFIELGVGFNPELSARENVALNGVLMGLGRREARRRLDSVIDFAELHDFIDLKVKNYSSGMMVRLAFAIMIQADPDIMLIDEVLAVGDAAFGQKCMDVFYQRRAAGKTIVLVTHDMSTVASLCHRAMVIQDGEVQHVGEPEETAIRYYRLNFAQEVPRVGQLHEDGKPAAEREVTVDLNARLVHARLIDEAGSSLTNIEQGQPLVLDVVFEAARELVDPIFVLHIRNVDGTRRVRGLAHAAGNGGQGSAHPARRADRQPAGARQLHAASAGSGATARSATWRSRACGWPSSSCSGPRPGTASCCSTTTSKPALEEALPWQSS